MNDHSFLAYFTGCRSLNYFLLVALRVAAGRTTKGSASSGGEALKMKSGVSMIAAIDSANKIVPVHEEACAAHIRTTTATAEHSTTPKRTFVLINLTYNKVQISIKNDVVHCLERKSADIDNQFASEISIKLWPRQQQQPKAWNIFTHFHWKCLFNHWCFGRTKSPRAFVVGGKPKSFVSPNFLRKHYYRCVWMAHFCLL